MVTDGYFYVPCYFTKKAVDQFHQKFGNQNITDLKNRVIKINEWTLELNRVNSANVFTSYGGLECRLVVKSFTPEPKKDESSNLPRTPFNLYRDDEMKILIQNYNHSAVSGAVKGASAALPDIAKMNTKGNVSQGIVSFGNPAYSHKEGKSQVVDLNSIFRQEKGADALKKQQVGNSGVRARGGVKASSKAIAKKGGAAPVTGKLAKFTPAGKAQAAKKSTTRIAKAIKGSLVSPGPDANKGTANVSSMRDFNKLVNRVKSLKGKKSTGRK